MGDVGRRAYTWVANRWVQWPAVDVVIAVALPALAVLFVRPGSSVDFLGRLSLEARIAFYGQLLQLVATFAGFASLAFTVYIGMTSRSLVRLRSVIGKPLLTVWLFALIMPWLADFVVLLAQAFDRGGMASPNLARWVVVGAVVLVILQLGRIGWVFYQVATIELKPAEQTPIRRNPITVVPPAGRTG